MSLNLELHNSGCMGLFWFTRNSDKVVTPLVDSDITYLGGVCMHQEMFKISGITCLTGKPNQL